MSESMAGVTFLAFGNGSPDVFSTFAAMSSHSGSLAIGELIGAAGFITAVVAGSMALVREFKVGKKTFVRDVGFFIVAVCFSMVFLADGSLHLWECCVMIGFYIFYVATVVTWHWYLSRRRRRRELDAAARGHYYAPGNEEIEVQEEDSDYEDAPAGERRPLTDHRSTEDFGVLEGGIGPAYVPEDDSDDDSNGEGREARRLAAEMSNSMRVVRTRGSRRNTMNPIRPSLVGALEFRSVLASLQKSRSMNSRPIHMRRYSDDPLASGVPSMPSSPAIGSDYATSITVTRPEDGEDSDPTPRPSISSRIRAASMNDATGLIPLDPAAYSVASIPDIGVVAATPTFSRLQSVLGGSDLGSPDPNSLTEDQDETPTRAAPPSPSFSISPPGSDTGSRDVSPGAMLGRRYEDRLAPPEGYFPGTRHLRSESPIIDPNGKSPRRPQIKIPSSSNVGGSRELSPLLAFPAYTDSPMPMSSHSSRAPSIFLPEAELSNVSSYITDGSEDYQPRPIWWWPYQLLPCPRVILATLFPTFTNWKDKPIWDKFLSIVSAPSIFLLAVTLPVVEAESTEADEIESAIEESRLRRRSTTKSIATPMLPADSPSHEAIPEPEWQRYRRSTLTRSHLDPLLATSESRGFVGHGNTATLSVSIENFHDHPHLQSPSFPFPTKHNEVRGQLEDLPRSPIQTVSEDNRPKDWNRWLVSVQIFTAPLFVMLIIWANTDDDSRDWTYLLHLILYSLLGSLIVFAILLLTTTPDKAPKYRFLLCFLGFVVSISWISTIANEVVGVLKTFGVILGISDAILGLTIFAVGNSLGDLVADITVARLGYPVMALSACFGGPMLNILLGIGISGLYMTLKEAKHKHQKHPGKPIKYKPYQIEVSGTLMISAIVLLITLVGLLIVVPMNNWVMSRRIGYGLIALWAIGTIVNLVVEITGVWS
jgi:sodium/potassium/calcium exchanger 6